MRKCKKLFIEGPFYRCRIMATKKGAPADSLAVRPVNGFEDGAILAFRGLIDSVRTLSSQDDYKLVDSYFDEIERLRGELRNKEQAFAAHTNLTTDLAKKQLSLREQLDERDTKIAQLSKEKEDLKEGVRKLEEGSKKQKGVLEKAKEKVKEQTEGLKAKDELIQKLEDKFKQARNQALRFEKELDSLKAEHDSLARRHKVVANRLEELESFAVRLHEDDSDAV